MILTHPAIADVAVIPKPDDEAGEILKTFVVLKLDQSLDADSLIGFVAEKIAAFKKIRALEFINQIPKSPSGKVLRHILVEGERAIS